MTERNDLWDEALEELCDGLLADEGVEANDENRRAILESIGLMPYALDEVEPAPRVRELLMAEIAATRSRTDARAEPGAPVYSLAEHRSAAQNRAGRELGGAPVPAVEPSRARWLLPVAAALLIALGGFAMQQASTTREQSTVIAELERQFEKIETRLAEVEEGRDTSRSFLAEVSRPGTEACALKPRLAAAPQAAHGTFYVLPGQEGYVLSINGLDDLPGKEFQIWFVTEESAVSGGTFKTGGRPYQLANDEMPPEGTRAVAITIEREGGVPEPTGPEVLFGAADEMISFL